MALSVPDQLAQLEAARQIVLADAGLYPQIVQGILPIVGVNSRLELRRWGAEFLAETFASPTFAAYQKENSAVGVLQILKDLLEKPGEDAAVIKSVVQTAASIYSLVFRYMYVRTLLPHCRQALVWPMRRFIRLCRRRGCCLTLFCSQYCEPARCSSMESDGLDQVKYIEEMGYCCYRSTNMLHQICTKGRPGANTRCNRRPKGAYQLNSSQLREFY